MRNKVIFSIIVAIYLSFTFGCSSEETRLNITEPVETTESVKQIQADEEFEIEAKKDEEIKAKEEAEKKDKQEQEMKAQKESETTSSVIPSSFTKGTVTKHVDGDTVHVTDENGQVLKIRMIGVDTPETVHPKKPVEFYGKEASDYTKEQLLNKTVYLEKDVSETDRYGRALRYIWLSPPSDPNNVSESEVRTKMFNALLVINGFANSSSYPPDIKYQSYFTKYEAEARNSNKGLWGDNTSKTEETKPNTEQTQMKQEPQETQNNNEDVNNNFSDKSDTNKNYSYMGNSNSMKLHKIDCQYAKKTSESNRVYFNSKSEASGYVPCKVCNP